MITEFFNIPVEENFFPQVYVDITFKCNMNCNTCYNPWYNLPDLDLNYFEEVCKRLPHKVWIRFVGGEPTIRENILFEAMRICKKYGHLVTIVTNGKRFAEDMNFTKELKDLKVPFFIALSFDGGINDNYYKIINGRDCTEMKLQALENMKLIGYKRVVLCCTLIRNLNEDIILPVINVSKKYDMIRYIHFRSQVHAGSWIEEEKAFNIQELENLILPYIPEWKNPHRVVRDGIHPTGVQSENKKCNNCCQCLWVTPDLQITLIDANSERIKKCHMRGHLGKDFTLTNFFETVYSTEKECLV